MMADRLARRRARGRPFCCPTSESLRVAGRPRQGRRTPGSVATETTALRKGRGPDQRLRRELPDDRNQL